MTVRESMFFNDRSGTAQTAPPFPVAGSESHHLSTCQTVGGPGPAGGDARAPPGATPGG